MRRICRKYKVNNEIFVAAIFFNNDEQFKNCSLVSFEAYKNNSIYWNKNFIQKLEDCHENFYLGEFYSNKSIVGRYNPKKAEEYFELASIDNPVANVILSESYLLGLFTEINYSFSKKHALKASELSKDKKIIIFKNYVISRIQVEASIAKKTEISRDDFLNIDIASKANITSATEYLLVLKDNNYISFNKLQSIDLLKLAAQQGILDAQYNYALFLYKEKNKAWSSWMHLLANEGYLDAIIFLSNYYMEQEEEALYLYWNKQAAILGDSISSFNHGIELIKYKYFLSHKEGVRFLNSAAKLGNREAYLVIATFLSEYACQNSDNNLKNKSVEYFRLSGEEMSVDAVCNLKR